MQPIFYETPPRKPITGLQLHFARREMKVTQDQLAQLLPSNRNLISSIENNKIVCPRSIEFAVSIMLKHFRATGKIVAPEILKNAVFDDPETPPA